MRLPTLASCLLLGLGAACPSKPAESLPPPKDIAAVVNGRPISETEVQLRRHTRGPNDGPITRDQALDQVVLAELEAQRAEKLGLDRDPSFMERMDLVAAQSRDARRFELAKVFRMKEVVDAAAPTEAQLKAFYEAKRHQLRTEYHLEQLTAVGRAAADADLAAIRAGAKFEDVALARAKAVLGSVPEGFKPYQLEPLRFDRIPPAWWPALDALAPGGVSEVIAMPRDRFVILHLLETRELDEPKLEDVRAQLEGLLKAQALEGRKEKVEAELLQEGKVERRPPPAPRPGGRDD